MWETPSKSKLENEFEILRNALLLMAGRVEEMISNSVKAVMDRDLRLAQKTIDDDSEVDRAEVEVDEHCLLILSTNQLQDSDLRFVVLSFKMVTDLERIGDLAVNISERAIDLAETPRLRSWNDLTRMGNLVQSMVRDAIDAYIDRDITKARQVIERDDEADNLYAQVYNDILDFMLKNLTSIANGIHFQTVAKSLERMADHSTNLAEQVIFMVQGTDVRHPDSTRP